MVSFLKNFAVAGVCVAAMTASAAGQLYSRSFNNPPGKPLPACSCTDLEALQDQLEAAEYGIREFERLARERAALEALPGGPPHITLAEYNALYNSISPTGPEMRHPIPGASTTTSDNSCKLEAAANRAAAPCKEIHDAYLQHEQLHEASCRAIWSSSGKSPFAFQRGSEVLQEEADGYKIAAGVYRKALEALLEKSVLNVTLTHHATKPESRFDAAFAATLAASPALPFDDGKVEWLGKGDMKFSDIVHFKDNRYAGCSAPDVTRPDDLIAITRDFRTLEFSHQPQSKAMWKFACKRGGGFSTEAISVLAERWKQYLIPTSKLELSSFGGVRGIGSVSAAPPQPGVTLPPGFPISALPPSVAAQIAALSTGAGALPPRKTMPWPPLIGRTNAANDVVVTRYKHPDQTPIKPGPTTQPDDRPELYVDDFDDPPMVVMETTLEMVCRP